MYKHKSEIINQIQLYHERVAQLYLDIYETTQDTKIKVLVSNLYTFEKCRSNYLEKHKKIAEVMNCYLNFPFNKLSDQISDCFNINIKNHDITINDIINIELHFDQCLIKLYNILSSEDKLNECVNNIFYYLIKKTENEKNIIIDMLNNQKIINNN